MKALALLFACFSAAAQVDPCTGQASTSPVWTQPAIDTLTCDGETGRTVDFNSKGAIAWRYCLTSGKYTAQVVAAPWSDLANTPGMALDLLKAWPSADNATIKTLLLKYRTGSFVDPAHAAVWCPFRDRIKAGMPSVPVWVTTSTVLYRLNDMGGLGAQVGTVPRGVEIAPSERLTISRMTFCQWKGGTSPFKTYVRCAQKTTP